VEWSRENVFDLSSFMGTLGLYKCMLLLLIVPHVVFLGEIESFEFFTLLDGLCL
jgi:hypothetical protein